MKTHNIFNIKDFISNTGLNSRLLGIDHGNKHIGIAICDENQVVATPLTTLHKTKFEKFLKEIIEIITENNIKGIIIGDPINMDGSLSKSAQSAHDFSRNLSKNITIAITMWDERLSSEGSFKITKNLGVNTSKKVKDLDKNAAAFILQGAIDYMSNLGLHR